MSRTEIFIYILLFVIAVYTCVCLIYCFVICTFQTIMFILHKMNKKMKKNEEPEPV